MYIGQDTDKWTLNDDLDLISQHVQLECRQPSLILVPNHPGPKAATKRLQRLRGSLPTNSLGIMLRHVFLGDGLSQREKIRCTFDARCIPLLPYTRYAALCVTPTRSL